MMAVGQRTSPFPDEHAFDYADRMHLEARRSTTPAAGLAQAVERTLPTGNQLAGVLPHLQRGTTIACTGAVSVALTMAVVAEASKRGSWVMVAGAPRFGVIAAHQAGISLARLVAVPGRQFTEVTWGDALAAAIDGFDLVVIGPQVVVRAPTARRLQARAQSRGAVLVVAGSSSPFAADVEIESESRGWDGLGVGHGAAEQQRIAVTVRGRRVHQPRQTLLALPRAG